MEPIAILSYATVLKPKGNKGEKYLIAGTYLDEVIKNTVKAIEENNAELVSVHSLYVNSENEIIGHIYSDAKFWERAFQLRTSKEV